MRTVSIRLIDLQVMKINLGFVGENEHTRVLIDCKKAFDQYPGAVPSLTVKPPQGDPYPAIVSRDGDIVSWDVTNSDLVYDGEGEIQLSFTQDNVVMKTYKGRTTIDKSILPSGEAPTPIQNWLDNANVALAEIPITITTALQEAKDSGEFDGFSPTVNIENIDGGHSVTITSVEGSNTFDVMDGLRGPQGDKGEDGLSPTVSVVTIADGHVVNITDKAGLHTFEVLDGRDGAPGQDGNDGVSPAVTVQDIDNGHRLIITDATGPHTFDVINGTTVVNKIARAPKSYSVASVTFNEGAGGAVINDDFCVHMVAYNANGSAYYPNDLTDKSFSTCNILHEYGDPDSPSSDTYSINFPAAAGDVYSATIYPQKGKLYVTGVMLTLNTANMDYEIDDTSEYATPGWRNSGAKALIGETYITIPLSNIGYGCVANTWGDNDLITLPRQVFFMTGQELINRAVDVQIILPLAEPIEYDFTPLEIATKQGYNRIAVSKNGSYYESIDVDFSLTYVADLGLFKFEDYAAKTDTVLDTTLSINRSEYAKIGEHSVAIGQHPEASGDNSLALGCYTVAAGENSVALGYYSRAIEFSSFAGGSQTSANGRFSFAYGYGATANGEDSAAFGNFSRAIASRAFAAGSSSVAAGESSFALGYGAITRGSGSFASGCSFANAQYSTALGRYSTANGYGSVVAGANAETYGDTAFAIGDRTIAAGQSSLVLGKQNVIDGAYNYEEWEPNRQYHVGDLVKVTTTTEVDGVEVPHISGYKCIIDVSQAQFREYEHTYNQETGRYEERTYWEPADYGQYVMIVGNGSGNYYDEDAGEWVYNRSNAFSIGWDGNVYIAGNLYAGCDPDGSNGSTLATSNDPVLTGYISQNRRSGHTPGENSVALGTGGYATGSASTTIGSYNNAEGSDSFAGGTYSSATASKSFVFGHNSHATAYCSVAIGEGAQATATNSMALGTYAHATGGHSHAQNYETTASGDYSTAIGYYTTASGEASTALGNSTTASAYASMAVGSSTIASGYSSFAGGYRSNASGSHSIAFGSSASAGGLQSAAFNSAQAYAPYSFATGQGTNARGNSSATFGYGTESIGYCSAAFGNYTTAAAQGSLSAGYGTIAGQDFSTVVGAYNVAGGVFDFEEWVAGKAYEVGDKVKITTTPENGQTYISAYVCVTPNTQEEFTDYVWDGQQSITYWQYTGIPTEEQNMFVVGNGEGNLERSNALTVKRSGDVYVNGNVYAGSEADGSGGSPVIKLSDIWVGDPNSVGQYALAIGMGTQALGNGSFAGGAGAVASGNCSFAFGGGSRATGENSFAFGGGAYAAGEDSFAIGGGTEAYGNWSIAGGAGSKSYGNGSVAIGNGVQAYGDSAFVVGQENFIDQRQADEWTPDTHYDVGDVVKVATNNSFYSCVFAHTSPEEFSTQDDQHTLWEHIDGSNRGYLFAVGNGTDNSHRSNALSVDKNGVGHFMGDVYANCLGDGTGGNKLAKVYNAEFENSISMGTSPGRVIGYNSVAIGDYSEAMSPHTLALGYFAKARGSSAVAIGNGARSGSQVGDQTMNTIAIGTDAYALRNNSVAIGQETKANGYQSLAAGYKSATKASNTVSIGYGTVAGANDSTVLGAYNVSDGFESFSEWEPNHEYHVGDYVKRTAPDGTVSGYECKTDNNLAEFMTSQQINGEWVTYWLPLTRNNYVLIVGNGNSEYYWGDYIDHRSNALAIGWDGSGHFGGNLYVNCNSDSTGGELVLTSSMKGAANGIAELDANGHVLISQLPSYVDDVVNGYLYNGVFYEDQQHQHAITAESNKIYVDLHTELTYRWSGVDYVEISPSIALGTTSSTAFRGDLGQIAYSHATDANRSTTAHVSGLYKIATTAEGHVASVTAVTKSDITALGIPGEQPDISVKVDKVALDNAGITSRTYVPLFGGEFEVTTAIRENKTVPYGRAGVSGRAHKENKHRVTINGTQYILPCQLCFTNSGLYEYIGNIDLADDYVGAEVTLNEKFDVPFFILFDDSDGQHQNIDLWTETAGTYTVLIERIDIEKNKIPNALIYDIEYSPLQIKNVPGTGSDPISIGVNGMTKGDLSTIGGNIAIGFGNIASGMSNYLIGNTNYSEGGINSALGMGNAVFNGTEMLQGSAVIGTGNVVMSPYSYAFGRSNSIARSGKFNIALGTFNNMYDGAEGSAVLGGYNNVAGAAYSNFTLGNNLENHSACSTVMGVSNFVDNTDFPRWVANTSYSVGDKVFNNKIGYQCSTANSDATFDESKWIAIMHSSKRALVVGNGGSSIRSNAFALDWNGDIHIMGKVYTDSNYDSTGGSRLISVSEIATVSETQAIINEYGVVS